MKTLPASSCVLPLSPFAQTPSLFPRNQFGPIDALSGAGCKADRSDDAELPESDPLPSTMAPRLRLDPSGSGPSRAFLSSCSGGETDFENPSPGAGLHFTFSLQEFQTWARGTDLWRERWAGGHRESTRGEARHSEADGLPFGTDAAAPSFEDVAFACFSLIQLRCLLTLCLAVSLSPPWVIGGAATGKRGNAAGWWTRAG